MFQIPAAITAIPIGWHNQEYARDGESLVPLSKEKRERIRRQARLDWSKRFVSNAAMEHLDKAAISVAREKYKQKMDDSHISAEVDKMFDEEFRGSNLFFRNHCKSLQTHLTIFPRYI